MDTYSQNIGYKAKEDTAEFDSLRSGFWVLLVAILGSSMAFIDSTAVNTILPVLQRELNASITQTQWIIEGYALFISSLILLGGALGDKFGRKKIFIIGLLVFSLSSIACGFSIGTKQLIFARAFQGVGGALLVPGSLAIINTSFNSESRGRALGVWSALSGATTGLGPVLGGWLAENMSWRLIFFINIPIALIVLAVLIFKVTEDKPHSAKKLDVLGSFLISAGLGFFIFGLIESSNHHFLSFHVIGTIFIALILMSFFVYYENRIENPILPLSIFNSKTFTGSNIVSFLFWAAWNAAIFFIPFGFIQLHGYTATEVAMGFLPAILMIFIAAPISGVLINKIGVRLPLMIGTFVISVAYFLFAFPGLSTTYINNWLLPIILMGLGIGIAISPMVSAVMGSIDKTYSGLGSGINNTVGRVAGLFAIAVLGVIAINSFNFGLDKLIHEIPLDMESRAFIDSEKIKLAGAQVPEWLPYDITTKLTLSIKQAFLSSFRIVMILNAILAFAGTVVAYFMIDDKKIDLK